MEQEPLFTSFLAEQLWRGGKQEVSFLPWDRKSLARLGKWLREHCPEPCQPQQLPVAELFELIAPGSQDRELVAQLRDSFQLKELDCLVAGRIPGDIEELKVIAVWPGWSGSLKAAEIAFRPLVERTAKEMEAKREEGWLFVALPSIHFPGASYLPPDSRRAEPDSRREDWLTRLILAGKERGVISEEDEGIFDLKPAIAFYTALVLALVGGLAELRQVGIEPQVELWGHSRGGAAILYLGDILSRLEGGFPIDNLVVHSLMPALGDLRAEMHWGFRALVGLTAVSATFGRLRPIYPLVAKISSFVVGIILRGVLPPDLLGSLAGAHAEVIADPAYRQPTAEVLKNLADPKRTANLPRGRKLRGGRTIVTIAPSDALCFANSIKKHLKGGARIGAIVLPPPRTNHYGFAHPLIQEWLMRLGETLQLWREELKRVLEERSDLSREQLCGLLEAELAPPLRFSLALSQQGGEEIILGWADDHHSPVEDLFYRVLQGQIPIGEAVRQRVESWSLEGTSLSPFEEEVVREVLAAIDGEASLRRQLGDELIAWAQQGPSAPLSELSEPVRKQLASYRDQLNNWLGLQGEGGGADEERRTIIMEEAEDFLRRLVGAILRLTEVTLEEALLLVLQFRHLQLLQSGPETSESAEANILVKLMGKLFRRNGFSSLSPRERGVLLAQWANYLTQAGLSFDSESGDGSIRLDRFKQWLEDIWRQLFGEEVPFS